MATRVVRNRQRPAPVRKEPTARELAQAKKLLQTFAETVDSIDDLVADRQRIERELESYMREHGIDKVMAREYVAGTFATTGRSSTRIDPRLFRKECDEKDFYECIDVVAARAKKVLSGKALERITTTTPGKAGDPEFSVRKLKG